MLIKNFRITSGNLESGIIKLRLSSAVTLA